MEVLRLIPAGACLTMDQLDPMTELTRRQIAKAAGKLISRGLLERIEAGCYQLTPAGIAARESGMPLTSGPNRRRPGPQPWRKETFRARMWRVMRMKKVFTVPMLLELASRGPNDTAQGCHRYLSVLRRAGYVMRLPGRAPGTAITSNGFAKYMLVKDTGHKWPLVRKHGVYDQNLREVAPFTGAQS
ncbi:MAG: hypothetical protein DCC73_11790 [Proteobacteria bacterium]|nr:MAG: hypothetical protein DCC73_11790 [Pseudomonadota bacterium]